MVQNSYPFTNPYGWSYFVIDGRCHYLASRDAREGTVEGELSAEETAQLANDIRYSKLPSWNGGFGRGCSEGSGDSLLSSTDQLTCLCGCNGAPDGAADAVANASTWRDMLADRGTQVSGAMRAVAQPTAVALPAMRHVWPLAAPINTVEGLVLQQFEHLTVESGVRFEGKDADALRKLRADAHAADEEARTQGRYAFGLLVNDETIPKGAEAPIDYRILLHDELPNGAAITDFFDRR